MKPDWRDGNRVRLLENGEEFFPRVFEALRRARVRVYIETFILLDDEVGRALLRALAEAAARGAVVDVLADGFGSEPLTPGYRAQMAAAGVQLHLYEPRPRLFGLRTNPFRRLHRKIVLIDGRLAFIGGINFCSDQLLASGPSALHDFAVELQGPGVGDIEQFVAHSRSAAHPPQAPVSASRVVGPARVRFVTRDNHRHPGDIEREYRVAIRAAQREILLANAYFFPGYRLLRDLRSAARRGVQVTVVVQGKADLRIVPVVARWLYHYLVPAGVRICEFRTRPLHAKVAVVDGRWATVGSSNLDPLSLSLNLEANLVIVDAGFGAELRARLLQLLAQHCTPVTAARVPRRTWWRIVSSMLVFHFLRHFPRWAERMPAAQPRIEHVRSDVRADR